MRLTATAARDFGCWVTLVDHCLRRLNNGRALSDETSTQTKELKTGSASISRAGQFRTTKLKDALFGCLCLPNMSPMIGKEV